MCLENTIFNRCEGVLVNMKVYLSQCKNGRKNQFGYGSILVTFFIRRVPMLRLQIVMGNLFLQDTRMMLWEKHMGRELGGRIDDWYGIGFISWWCHQIVGIKDFTYESMDFQQDPGLSHPLERYGDLLVNVFLDFIFFQCFLYFWYIWYFYGWNMNDINFFWSHM